MDTSTTAIAAVDFGPLYLYRATLAAVTDADTLDLEVDQGLRHYQRIKRARLYGLNAPEKNTADGRNAVEFVCDWLNSYAPPHPMFPELMVRTVKDRTEKYGGFLVVVFNPDMTRCLNDDLIIAGHAAPWDGHGARPVPTPPAG